MRSFTPFKYFTGYQVAYDLLNCASGWPVTKDHPIATGFVEAGLEGLVAFIDDENRDIGPTVDAIASGLELAGYEPKDVERIFNAVMNAINTPKSQANWSWCGQSVSK